MMKQRVGFLLVLSVLATLVAQPAVVSSAGTTYLYVQQRRQ